jgi:hypothetical protein
MTRTARTRRFDRRPGGALAALPAVAALAILALATPTLAAAADAPPAATERPARGMTKAQVEARYGAPTARQDAVGNPPISRWDYPGMRVYFENDHVVHAVLMPTG